MKDWLTVQTSDDYAKEVRQWLPDLTAKQVTYMGMQLHNFDADCYLDSKYGHGLASESLTRLYALSDLFGHTIHYRYDEWIREQIRQIQGKYHKD